MASANGFHRIVHMDLKGLPPTAKRLVQLPEFFASLGLTGVLVEWEDTFPYPSVPEMKAPYTYSPKVIREFLAEARRAKLLVIPLVQTFGHLESLLVNRKYRYLREIPDDPRCLCPRHPDSLGVVRGMLDDVIRVHADYGLEYLHLGGDEVYGLGACPKCKAFVAAHGRDSLYLKHMTPLFDSVNAQGVRPMIWHDMMRGWSPAAIKPLVNRVDVMFWNYGWLSEHVENFCSPRDMKLFRSIGVECWGAAAYKGADGPDRNIPDLDRRGLNTQIWHDLAKKYQLKGIALTAWTRYNTMIACCEPIESTWDSLAMCTAVLQKGTFDFDADLRQARKRLYGTADPEKQAPKKNKDLWAAFKAAQDLEAWVQNFDTNHFRRTFWACPGMWDESRYNPQEVSCTIHHARQHLADFEKIAATVRKACKGYVSDDEVEHFLSSRIKPRKKVWQLIERELRRLRASA